MRNTAISRKITGLTVSTVMASLAAMALAGCSSGSEDGGSEPAGQESSATTDPYIAKIKESGVLKVATLTNNLPWETLGSTGKPEGFEPDLVNALADSLGVKVDWLKVDQAGRITALTSDKANLTAASLAITPERADAIDFSEPFVLDGLGFVVKSDAPFESYGDLNSGDVTYCTTAGGTAVTEVPEVLPDAKALNLPDVAACLQAVNTGHAQVLTQDTFYNQKLMKENEGKYKLVPQPDDPDTSLDWFQSTEVGIGIPQGKTAWKDYIDSFIEDYAESGDLKSSFEEWFGYDMRDELVPEDLQDAVNGN